MSTSASKTAATSTEEKNKALVRRAVEEVWSGGNFALVDELTSPGVVIHRPSPAEDIHGPEGIRQFYSALRNALPDIHFTIEDQIAEGDRVVTRWTARARHLGELNGIPPTGKQVSVAGIDVDRFEDGRVVECWTLQDDLGMMRQLGVI